MFKHLQTKSSFAKNSTLLKANKKTIDPQTLSTNGSRKFYTSPRRMFSNTNPLNLIPPITRAILYANCGIYFFGYFMSNADYIKSFFYNQHALRNGRFQTLVTCHFAKGNFLDFVIDTVITGLIGSSTERMLSSGLMKRLVFASAGLGSLLLITMHKENSFIKSDAILRGLIMAMIFIMPNSSFMLIPFPIQVKAAWIGIILVCLDFISAKWVNFGGTIAAFMLTKKLI